MLFNRVLFTFLAAQPDSNPVFIKLDPPPSDIEGLGEVLLGALGITGVIVVAALACGLVFAGVIYGVRRLQSARDDDTASGL